jgi:hypothetical protein
MQYLIQVCAPVRRIFRRFRACRAPNPGQKSVGYPQWLTSKPLIGETSSSDNLITAGIINTIYRIISILNYPLPSDADIP